MACNGDSKLFFEAGASKFKVSPEMYRSAYDWCEVSQ